MTLNEVVHLFRWFLVGWVACGWVVWIAVSLRRGWGEH